MSRIKALRAEAQKLYAEASKITHGDERLVVVLRALELETEAEVLERESAPVQQQQQPQPDDKKQ